MAANPEHRHSYTGQVVEVDEENRRFKLRLEDGYERWFDATEEEMPLAFTAFYCPQFYVVEVTESGNCPIGKLRLTESSPASFGKTWDELLAPVLALPEDTWAHLPRDYAENLDHYLYGEGRPTE
jgi:hypothetical protein